MTEIERWIIDTIPKHGGVDILNEEFVDKFIKRFNSRHRVTLFGAYKCPSLGILLSHMYRKGFLTRNIIGICPWQAGFPKWVYVYGVHSNYL